MWHKYSVAFCVCVASTQLSCALSNKASQYNYCLICKSMRNINRVLTLAIDECEVANHFDSNILLSLNFKITLYTLYF